MAARQINTAGLNLVKSQESCRLSAYFDQYGRVWTIGWGETGPQVHAGLTITQAQADAWLLARLQTTETSVGNIVKAPLNDNQFAALVDFTYNAGAGNLDKMVANSGLNQKNYAGVPQHLVQYTHAANGQEVPDLVRRREAEVKLWDTPVSTGVARMALTLPTQQQLGGLGRDAMKVIGGGIMFAGTIALIPPDQVTSLMADLQHLKNAGHELALAFLGSGGILAIAGIWWTLLKNTWKGLIQSASTVPDTKVVTQPAIAAATPNQGNIVSNTTNTVVPTSSGVQK